MKTPYSEIREKARAAIAAKKVRRQFAESVGTKLEDWDPSWTVGEMIDFVENLTRLGYKNFSSTFGSSEALYEHLNSARKAL